MKVLIADQDWHFAQQATEFLEYRANLVVHVIRAEEAIANVRHWQPDLAIVSAEMADSGLFEAISAVTPAPAVVLTEHMSRFDRAWKAWQKGGDELLLKPILRGSDLTEAIVGAMQNAAAGKRTRRRRFAASA